MRGTTQRVVPLVTPQGPHAAGTVDLLTSWLRWLVSTGDIREPARLAKQCDIWAGGAESAP